MAQNSFVYDPSASIKEGFKDISTNIGAAFSNIIAQKQQDLALADKVFQNLDAIKEETAAIGSQRINQAIKGLTTAAPNAMFKDGKIDYEGMGKVMSGVSQIKQLKNWWSNAAELKKQYLQLGTASSKDMTSFSSYISQIDPLIAENEGGSIEDLKKKMSSLYDSHLDYTNIAREKVTSFFPTDKYVGEMENEKKGITEYSFTGPKGLLEFNKKTLKPELAAPTILTDPATNKPILDANGKPQLVSTLDKVKGALTQGDPAFFDKYRNHFGLSKALVPDDVVAKQVLESFATAPAFKETKSFEKIQTEKNELKTSTVEAENIGTLTALKIKQIKADIAATQKRANYYDTKGKGSSGAPKNAVVPIIGTTKEGSRYMSLTKPVTIVATGAYKNRVNSDKKAAEFEVQRIIVDAKGRIFAKGSVKTGQYGQKTIQDIMLSQSDYKEFINKLGGMEAVHRYSNSYGLQELGLPNLPKSYLNIAQDETPDGDYNIEERL
jgi:hypothetical protein